MAYSKLMTLKVSTSLGEGGVRERETDGERDEREGERGGEELRV